MQSCWENWELLILNGVWRPRDYSGLSPVDSAQRGVKVGIAFKIKKREWMNAMPTNQRLKQSIAVAKRLRSELKQSMADMNRLFREIKARTPKKTRFRNSK